MAPEKILKKVRALEAAGAEAIHLSSCLMGFCPFKKQYVKLLEKNFPQLEIVCGTHSPQADVPADVIVEAMKQILSMEKPSMGTVGKFVEERMASISL